MFNRYRKEDSSPLRAIPEKANYVLKIILCILLIIGLRIWHLGVIQHDKKKQEAFQPRRKVILEPAVRGTIRDRFNVVLAANKQEYRLSIIYSQFRDVPAWITEYDETGKRLRRYLRREYIHKLSELLSSILHIDAERLEDIIHSHGSLNNTIPLVIKRGLTEHEYFRLKALEKDWLGVQVQLVPKRYYPKGKIGCDVVGYLGPISKEKYSALIAEISALSNYVALYELGQEPELPEGVASFVEAKARLLKLQEKAYGINDSVGVLGVEASLEEGLRGYSGKRVFFSDARGNSLRELPGTSRPTSGKRVLLSISSELQEYAEILLAENELHREKGHNKSRKEPIMRGGAIVAMDPKNGDVLALASYPRFDPNDFIRAKSAFFDEESPQDVQRWIESDSFFSKVWDGRVDLTREVYKDGFYDEHTKLSWELFLELLLPLESGLFQKLNKKTSIVELVAMQRDFFALYNAYPDMKLEKLVELDALNMWFEGLKTVQEKLLYVDLSRLVVWHEDMTDGLISAIGHFSIEEFRDIASQYRTACVQMQKRTKELWEKHSFSNWRKEHEKSFLREKRLEERRLNRYARPYLEYIDSEREKQFSQFWTAHEHEIMAHAMQKLPIPKEYIGPFLHSLKGYSDYTYSLIMPYGGLYSRTKEPIGKDLIASAIKVYSPGYCRSLAYRHAAIQGSLFKLVTSYAGLKQRYNEGKTKDISLFTIHDKVFKKDGQTFVGYFPTGKPIPQLYKGGRIPKSLSKNIGTLDLLRAFETSSNPYFSLLAAEFLKDPNDLVLAAREFGLGEKTGIRLPMEVRGNIPSDVTTNKTGLYSFAIGQHTLLTTPLQSANMLACVANGGHLLEPKIIELIVGKDPPFEEKELKKHGRFAYQDALGLVGIDFPLFIKTNDFSVKNNVEIVPTVEIGDVFMPKEIQGTLLEGLRRVMGRLKTPYVSNQLIGKTSTAESQERIGLGCGYPSVIYNHTWFGGISYNSPVTQPLAFESPELVVVVYLRYGSYGREVAPIAAKMVQKWRELNQKA